jgi:hypothetical protein
MELERLSEEKKEWKKKTQYLFLKGKGKWIRARQIDQYGSWSMVLYPDAESLKIIKQLIDKGLKNTLRKDQDGENMSFKRLPSKVIRGKLVPFANPDILNKDGEPWDIQPGNGSDVTMKISVYEYKSPMGAKGIAARWESVRIDNLVPFESSRDYDERQQIQIEGLKEQPPQLF